MKGFKVGAVLVLSILLMSSRANAQMSGKVAYVDLSRLFDEYTKTKEYDKVLEEQHNKYQQARDTKLQKIKDAQAKLALLKEDEKAKLQDQMERDRQTLLEFDNQQQTELRKQRDEKIREILQEIEKVVKDFAEKEKYDMILNDRVLVYGNPDMNQTEKILKLLNDSYGGGKK